MKLEPGWDEPLQLDLMIAEGGSYASALGSRYPVAQEDMELWLVSREQLIAMKREAGRPIDQQDIDRIG